MRDSALEALEILGRGARTDLQVVGVARLERELLAGLDLDDRRDVGMPAVVAGLRLLAQPLAAIDRYVLHAASRGMRCPFALATLKTGRRKPRAANGRLLTA